MVKLFDKSHRLRKENIKADVIILGCSLPGIVTAHKLKKRFGNTMDIVVLDLATTNATASKCNVAFLKDVGSDSSETTSEKSQDKVANERPDEQGRRYLSRYAKEFDIPLPDAIIAPEKDRSQFSKLFQHKNGSAVPCYKDYHDFDYLSFVEKFELDQYQTLLDRCTRSLFRLNTVNSAAEKQRLLYYDQTPMEKHMCNSLIFPTSREIMRTTVRLVCGASASTVSVLFYLHQCHRTNSGRNHLDGHNLRFREKLLGYCRKRLSNKLQKSIADITRPARSIKEIRVNEEEQVIVESTSLRGDSNYVCNLLAMALRPDELHNIRVEAQLLPEEEATKASRMTAGRSMKFSIQYEDYFWRRDGYSGDILSVQGPIIWAMERPKMSTTGSMEKYAALIGYLKVKDGILDSKEAVIDQLVKLFGEEAATPISYSEKPVIGTFIPRCGDYVAVSSLIGRESPKYLEWGAFDIFADGDVAAALEAGHSAYIHLMSCLRPQAQTYEDMTMTDWPTDLDSPLQQWLANHQFMASIRLVACATAIVIGVSLIRSYMRK